MSKNRVVEEYRGYDLLAMLHEGKYKGRVWRDKELLSEIEADGIDETLSSLKEFVDNQFVAIAEGRTQQPASMEYVKAFQKILEGLPDSYLAMLKAHYLAPDQLITATQLAEAAGYSSYGAANLHYGTLGKQLNEELPIRLPKRKNGSYIFTYALATAGDTDGDEGQWIWKMRPEVSAAIKSLGLYS